MGKEEVLQAIKELSVVELADLVKGLEDEFGISAAPAAVVAAPAAASAPNDGSDAPAEEQSEFNVILQDFGDNKINVIKAVRQVTALGLKESKDLVESAPKAIKEGVPKEEANEAKKKLEDAGAKATLE